MFQRTTIGLAVALILAVTACSAPQNVSPTAVPTQPPAPTEAPAATEAPSPTEAPAATKAPAAAMIYAIDPARSKALFVLNEELFGVPTTVTGTTKILNGSITADWSAPANTTISPIEIDAKGFATDNERRNGAIRRFILQTDQFPKITFEPIAIEGLPTQVNAGDSLTFKVTGNLTVRDITVPVTFDVTAIANSEDEISGTARAQVLRSDFELNIPSVPGVANVSDEVALQLDFVAAKQ